jgi:8-oxo-dGTP diphosphatase
MMPVIRVVAAAVIVDGRLLAALRGPKMSRPGRWELPGGKVEAGESDADALVREIREELGCEIAVDACLGEVADPPVLLVGYRCRLVAGVPTATEHAELRWIGRSAVEGLDWAAPDVPLVAALRDQLGDDEPGAR